MGRKRIECTCTCLYVHCDMMAIATGVWWEGLDILGRGRRDN